MVQPLNNVTEVKIDYRRLAKRSAIYYLCIVFFMVLDY